MIFIIFLFLLIYSFFPLFKNLKNIYNKNHFVIENLISLLSIILNKRFLRIIAKNSLYLIGITLILDAIVTLTNQELIKRLSKFNYYILSLSLEYDPNKIIPKHLLYFVKHLLATILNELICLLKLF